MRARIAVVVVAACVGVVALAACASTVNGTGLGSAPPAPASTPATSPLVSAPPIATAPVSPPASASSSTPAPSSSAPSSQPPANPLDRTVEQTAVGDPVTNDFCTAQGTDMLEPSGDDVEFSATQYLASCTWRLRKHDVTQVDVTENANRASQVTANPSAKRTTVAGQRVDVEPLERDSGICNRWVYGRGVVVTVQGYAISVPHTSPDICRAADRVVRTTAELLASGKHTPLTLADPTISDLDMCKVVTAGHLMNAAVLAKASQNSFNFDADCEVSSSTVTFFVDSAIAHPGAQENHVPRSIGKHTVLASTNNDKSYCAYSAPQGATGSQSDHESIEFSMNASSISNPPKQLCAKTLQLVAAFLDAGGLR